MEYPTKVIGRIHLIYRQLHNSSYSLGIFTARDLLRSINTVMKNKYEEGRKSAAELMIKDVMTTKRKLLYCSPNDSVRRCREMMSQSKIRNMPILENGEVLGIITLKDLADSSFKVLSSFALYSMLVDCEI
jgi:CBS domain-containing protein